MLQLTNVKNPDVSEEKYMDVIHGKTAMLFEASTHSAAALLQLNESETHALQEYGKELGLAFQLIDDVLDYEGDASELGKNVGDDLAEGKPTLPLIHAMAHAGEDGRMLIRQAIRKGGLDDMDAVMAIVRECGSMEYTRNKANECRDRAIAHLQQVPDSVARDALIALANIAVERTA